jgi:2-polyprenyl-6-methoxyphenol hydroxylase-like FAD-dependent oxidoreductase
VPRGMVRWGAKVQSVVEDDDSKAGPRSLKIEEAGEVRTEGPFDLIVGADGAWSKIRARLTDARPVYSTVSGLDIRIPEVDTNYPELGTLLGRGSVFVFGEEEKRVLLIQRNGDGSVRVYAVGLGRPEGWANEMKTKTMEEVTATVLKDYQNWAPELQKLIAVCSSSSVTTTPRALYMLPLDQLSWTTRPGLTLLGDAAHLMTPFAGQGVNMAMLDALELAQKIIAASQTNEFDLVAAVAEYEREMFPRAQKMAHITWDSLEARFAAGGIVHMKAKMGGFLAARKEATEKAARKGV